VNVHVATIQVLLFAKVVVVVTTLPTGAEEFVVVVKFVV